MTTRNVLTIGSHRFRGKLYIDTYAAPGWAADTTHQRYGPRFMPILDVNFSKQERDSPFLIFVPSRDRYAYRHEPKWLRILRERGINLRTHLATTATALPPAAQLPLPIATRAHSRHVSHSSRVKHARFMLNLTQHQLATLLNVRQPTIARWEGGQSVPSATQLAKLRALRHAK